MIANARVTAVPMSVPLPCAGRLLTLRDMQSAGPVFGPRSAEIPAGDSRLVQNAEISAQERQAPTTSDWQRARISARSVPNSDGWFDWKSALPDRGERSVSGLSAREDGFSVHAATTAPAEDARARETLCKYVLRPPLAQERVRVLENGMVRIVLKRPFSDGTTAIDLDPLSLLCRLAASVPPPRTHRVHYSGVLAAAHTWRARVVPPLPPEDAEDAAANDDACCHDHAHDETAADARPATHRSGYRPWRELLKRTFKIDLENCAKCA